MKEIDYDLVEKVGATHYAQFNEDATIYAKFIGNDLFVTTESQSWGWWLCKWSHKDIICIKQIPPRPQPEYEYVSVEPSEAVYYFDNNAGEMYSGESENEKLVDLQDYINVLANEGCNLYRRVERTKPDWQEAIVKYLCDQSNGNEMIGETLANHLNGMNYSYMSTNDFLGMCRVALRATGEID